MEILNIRPVQNTAFIHPMRQEVHVVKAADNQGVHVHSVDVHGSNSIIEVRAE